MSKLVSIGEAALILGVAPSTLRRWHAEGRLVPERTVGGQRRYNVATLRPEVASGERVTLAYARVSSHDTVFSARLYGSRSRKNKRLLEAVHKAVKS